LTVPNPETPPAQPSGGDQGGGGQPPSTGPSNTLTQEELSRIATREKAEGRTAGRRELEQELSQKFGVSLEEAEKLIREARERDDAQKTEAQREKEAAERERKAAEAEKAAAAADRHAVKVERALTAAGFQPRKDEDLASFQERLARCARLVDAEVGADDSAIQGAVTKVKEEFTELFSQTPASGFRPPSGDPQGTPPAKPPASPGDAKQRAHERAVRMGFAKAQAS
jgi:hypothetical protein